MRGSPRWEHYFVSETIVFNFNEKKYDEKKKSCCCHRQPEGWRGKSVFTVLLASVLHYRKDVWRLWTVTPRSTASP